MANTYTKMHLQFVFAVKHRRAMIDPSWEEELYKYITGIIQNHTHKLLAINGVEDHIHILVGMRPTQSVSDLLQDIKGDSSIWINEKNLTKTKFEWQSGFGAFSYSPRDVNNVIQYILNQKEHHKKNNFKEEYLGMLREYDIDFEEKYTFLDLA